MSSNQMFGVWCTQKLEPNERPSNLEIFLPPFLLLGLLFAALAGLSLKDVYTDKKRKKKFLADNDFREKENIENQEDNIIEKLGSNKDFMTDYDNEVLSCLRTSKNKPKALIIIALPCMVCLLTTTTILIFSSPLLGCLWPLREKPDINTAISCFLLPAGLVYALSFGFVFAEALEKQRIILLQLTQELSLLDHIITVTYKMDLPSKQHKLAIFNVAKAEAISLAVMVQNRFTTSFANKAPPNLKVQIWSIVDILRDAASHKENGFSLNHSLAKTLISNVMQLNNICMDRMGTIHTRIHPMKWIFLEILGNQVLFGVMLVSANSQKMEMAICEITIFSISMLCLVLADLDNPFNGFFQVDLGVLLGVVKRMEEVYMSTFEDQVHSLRYPDHVHA